MSLEIVLEGQVSVVEKDDSGKIISSEELDSDIVLRIVRNAIEDGIKRLIEKEELSDSET